MILANSVRRTILVPRHVVFVGTTTTRMPLGLFHREGRVVFHTASSYGVAHVVAVDNIIDGVVRTTATRRRVSSVLHKKLKALVGFDKQTASVLMVVVLAR